MDHGEAACREIHDFHRFLEGWLRADIPFDEGRLKLRLTAFHPNFLYITPTGRRRGLADLREWFHGSNGGESSLRIEIAFVEIRHCDEAAVLALYEERQCSERETTRRLSSALFRVNDSTPNGLAWFHLHEVWLPG